MAVGFPTAGLKGPQQEFLHTLGATAQQRNRDLTARVNRHLKPVELDYERDVLPLTPSGNATERHICLAYAHKARQIFQETAPLRKFWAEKLHQDAESLDLPEGMSLLNTIRAKTMKRGGVGYVLPDKGSFPLLAAIARPRASDIDRMAFIPRTPLRCMA